MTRPYITPPNTRIYAIGDLHGHRAELTKMMNLITEDVRGRDIKHVKVVFLGDYIDRGPDSAGLLDDLIALKNGDLPFEFIFLKGNHEHWLLEFMRDPLINSNEWLVWGGVETMQSYYVIHDPRRPIADQVKFLSKSLNEKVPASHQEFLKSLDVYYQCGDYLFVHAGIRPNFPLHEQAPEDMWMIRETFIEYEGLHPWRVVHGHTISEHPELLPNRINVDTGLYRHGVLTCAVLENDTVEFLQVRA